MSMTMVELPNQDIITNVTMRHSAVFLWDVLMGNPNGDPERDNLPRQNLNDLHGFVTDGSIKRKVRDYWARLLENQEGYRIYVQSSAIAGALNTRLAEADAAVYGDRSFGEAQSNGGGTQQAGAKTAVAKKPIRRSQVDEVAKRQQYMVEHFIDNRLFGAVMGTGNYPAGHVTGPVQVTFGRSIDEIEIMDLQISRVAVTKEDEVEAGKVSELGRRSVIPYALYKAFVFFNAPLARDTGVTSRDLELLWAALQSVWELDRSEARGMQSFRGIVIWSEENQYGNVHAHKLVLDRVQVHLKPGKQFPREFDDYDIVINDTDLPQGVTCTKIGFNSLGGL
jgi:CRISPR-associated protein Csd2